MYKRPVVKRPVVRRPVVFLSQVLTYVDRQEISPLVQIKKQLTSWILNLLIITEQLETIIAIPSLQVLGQDVLLEQILIVMMQQKPFGSQQLQLSRHFELIPIAFEVTFYLRESNKCNGYIQN